MPSPDVASGFTSRQAAIKEYGRSKSSFIRDVQDAFERGDTDFLEHFRVYLNDGSFVPGPEATKDKIASLQHKQPRTYIETSFLQTRYWEGDQPASGEASKTSVRSNRNSGSRGLPLRLEGADTVTQLQHELALERKENEANHRQIESLKSENSFLREELTDRRKDMKELTDLIDVMRKALPEYRKTKPDESPDVPTQEAPHDVIDVVERPEQARQGTAAADTKIANQSVSKNAKSRRGKSVAAKQKPKSKDRKPKWYETPNIPSLQRAAKAVHRFFRR